MPYPRQPSVHMTPDLDSFRAAVASFAATEIQPHISTRPVYGRPVRFAHQIGREGSIRKQRQGCGRQKILFHDSLRSIDR